MHFLFGLATLAYFASALPAPRSTIGPLDKTQSLVSIQQTLSLFALAVDQHDYGYFPKMFTQDVIVRTANATGISGPPISGLADLTTVLSTSLAGFECHRALSGLTVNFTSAVTATATQYQVGTFFGQNELVGQIYASYGRYEDVLQRQKDGRWLVSQRVLVTTGSTGNTAILAAK